MSKKTKLTIFETIHLLLCWGMGIYSIYLKFMGNPYYFLMFITTLFVAMIGVTLYLRLWFSGGLEPWQLDGEQGEHE